MNDLMLVGRNRPSSAVLRRGRAAGHSAAYVPWTAQYDQEKKGPIARPRRNTAEEGLLRPTSIKSFIAASLSQQRPFLDPSQMSVVVVSGRRRKARPA